MPPRGRGRATRTTARASNSISHTQDSLQLQDSDLSSAPLTGHHNLVLAHSGAPTDAEFRTAHLTGLEAISDATNALRKPLIPVRPWRRLWDPSTSHHPHHYNAVASSDGVEWRSAPLAYPCSCNLPTWSCVYAPPFLPPTARDLPALPPHPDIGHLPRFGSDVPDWSDFGTEGDLDPALDDMAEFELVWPTATPWRRDKGKGRSAPSSPRFVTQCSPSSHFCDRPSPPSSLNSAVDSRSKKRPPSSSFKHPPRRERILPPSPPGVHRAPPSSALSTPSRKDLPLPNDYVKDARVRRAWWRDTVTVGCGAFWKCISRPVYPAPAIRRPPLLERDDAFRPPRNLASLNHPLHPDVAHYCKHARARVYWLIPIHGPVIIPGLEDPVTNDSARPWASRAEFDARASESSRSKPIVVRWTPALLNAFLKERFEPAWRDPSQYGALHLAFSGPKPDPYLALPPSAPLAAHQYVPPHARERTPVRVEVGDHLRIYCDAALALSIRTWLHWWETEGRRPFEGARFALIGPRGEVLVVA
ncbi:hypothetical protein CC85DRAFT_330055 [Cutaneotrichosporon oleaginosum]|uniref:Uncharacterized protein n=1 Tax=Cutaneotrichosporon oleaginosum TaxID=879819 RepID=A0A0J0XGW1_9TREE|nr:uncharacterized protein CC85DRAFT_330055 [Cutaneotrichosporon oleaginosum]KLT40267.1 hypothetical protein CC85DRAFT_330055 [Cutaneotrichosporon oleaginosum]TXT11284.1 hypothetical protein COLE_01694 [Cutaneotrichosporon oleaginosum]